MEIFDGHRALFRPLIQPAIALGNFDGVHVGHQRLLGQTVRAAERLGGDALVFTFDPHPASVLAPESAPPLLTPRPRKLELFAAMGLSAAIIEPFTAELAALSPDDFARAILVDVIGARHVVVGYDFAYGNKRAGNAETLRAFGRAHGFEVAIIEPVMAGGVVASSSQVRAFLRQGDMAGARLVLGRDFDVDGLVVRGEGRGRIIGVPTANLHTGGVLLPMPGVYAVRARVQGGEPGALPGCDDAALAVANLGNRPTFGGQDLSLEVHLLDVTADLYGRTLRVEFVERLRGEQRFDGIESLVRQIRTDIDHARIALA
jgi:riboflavin kinase / FMN adenylyltransferase